MSPQAILTVALAAFVPASFAQPWAQVSGTISDATGAILAGARISVVNNANGIRRDTRSNQEGAYAVTSLQPGTYKITVRHDGFQTVARLGVDLDKARAARVDFTLPLGNMQEVVTIEGGAPLVNLENGSVGTIVDRGLADHLPLNGRTLQALFDLSPGIVATPATAGEAGQFAVNGQRANTNYFYIDGVSANTGVSGGGLPGTFSGSTMPGMSAIGSLHNLVTLEEAQELRIQTSTFTPEFGRMSGAQVSVTTSAGSNALHGSFFENFRHERLSAKNWFSGSAGLGRGKLRANDFGAALGGPVRRDHAFFFASYEYLGLHHPYTWRLAVPSRAARQGAMGVARALLDAFPWPNGPDLGNSQAELTVQSSQRSRLATASLRLDQSMGSRANLFARYTEAPSASQFGFFQLNDARFRWRSLTFGATAALGVALTNDARLNVGQAAAKSFWMTNRSGGAQPLDLPSLLPALNTGQNVIYGLSIAGLDPFLSGGNGTSEQGQLYFANTLALDGGKHHMRFGAQYQRLAPRRDRTVVSEVGSYSSLKGLLDGEPMLVTSARAGQASSVIETFSVFAQDTWQVNPRAALTYGARWEVTPPPALRSADPLAPRTESNVSVSPGGAAGIPLPPAVPTPVNGPIWPTRYTQFAPRVGAAHRLTPEGALVLRAGAGVFYDLGFASAADPINGGPYNGWQVLTGVAAPATKSRSLSYGFAPNLRVPLSIQWNLAVERQFGNTDVATVSYVGSAGYSLLRREAYLQPEAPSTELVLATNHGASNYHAFQAQYRRRVVRGLRGVAAYTWAHSIDNGSWDSSVMLLFPGATAAGDRGSSNFDVRHAATVAMAYELPGDVLRGWSVDGILRARTGFPVDILSAESAFGIGFDNATRPNFAPNAPIWLNDSGAPGGRRLNRGAFWLPGNGAQGNLGRNVIGGLGMYQVDFALRKQFALPGERFLQARFEAFNLTNHVDFADPVRFLSSGAFGESVSLLNLMLGTGAPRSGLTPAFQVGGPRSLQIALQLRF